MKDPWSLAGVESLEFRACLGHVAGRPRSYLPLKDFGKRSAHRTLLGLHEQKLYITEDDSLSECWQSTPLQ
jgi:hypothetical protein